MTDELKSNEHKCGFCGKVYSCEGCNLPINASCNDCYDKGLIE